MTPTEQYLAASAHLIEIVRAQEPAICQAACAVGPAMVATCCPAWLRKAMVMSEATTVPPVTSLRFIGFLLSWWLVESADG